MGAEQNEGGGMMKKSAAEKRRVVVPVNFAWHRNCAVETPWWR